MFESFDTVADVRRQFRALAPDEGGMLELVNVRFVADEPSIFGAPNDDWHERELRWYLSTSLSVDDIPAPVPKIWRDVASSGGQINSNYGWCIFSEANGLQFHNAVEALRRDPYTRQAVMIYTRPSMHRDWNVDGMRDFICTNTVQLLFRENRLHYFVNMRSSDAVFGYKGDLAWHRYVHQRACEETGTDPGAVVWNAGSLHVYPRHHHLVGE